MDEETQEEFRERHFIPSNEECYRIENYDEFLSRRGELIKEHLMSVLTESGE